MTTTTDEVLKKATQYWFEGNYQGFLDLIVDVEKFENLGDKIKFAAKFHAYNWHNKKEFKDFYFKLIKECNEHSQGALSDLTDIGVPTSWIKEFAIEYGSSHNLEVTCLEYGTDILMKYVREVPTTDLDHVKSLGSISSCDSYCKEIDELKEVRKIDLEKSKYKKEQDEILDLISKSKLYDAASIFKTYEDKVNKSGEAYHAFLNKVGNEFLHIAICKSNRFDDTSRFEDLIIASGKERSITDLLKYHSTRKTKALKALYAKGTPTITQDNMLGEFNALDSRELAEFAKTVESSPILEKVIANLAFEGDIAEILAHNKNIKEEKIFERLGTIKTKEIKAAIKKIHDDKVSQILASNDYATLMVAAHEYRNDLSILQWMLDHANPQQLVDYYYTSVYSINNDMETFASKIEKTLLEKMKKELEAGGGLSCYEPLRKWVTFRHASKEAMFECFNRTFGDQIVVLLKSDKVKAATLDNLIEYKTKSGYSNHWLDTYIIETKGVDEITKYISQIPERYKPAVIHLLEEKISASVKVAVLEKLKLDKPVSNDLTNVTQYTDFLEIAKRTGHTKEADAWIKTCSVQIQVKYYLDESIVFTAEDKALFASHLYAIFINHRIAQKDILESWLHCKDSSEYILNVYFSFYEDDPDAACLKKRFPNASPEFLANFCNKNSYKPHDTIVKFVAQSFNSEQVVQFSIATNHRYVDQLIEHCYSTTLKHDLKVLSSKPKTVDVPMVDAKLGSTIPSTDQSFVTSPSPSTVTSKKENIMSNTTLDKFLSTVKSDAKSAGYATAANLSTELVKSGLITLLDNNTEDSRMAEGLAAFLETELGSALIQALIGYGLTYGVTLTNPHQIAMAEKFRQKGMETVFTSMGMKVMESAGPLIGQITNLLPDENGEINAANIVSATTALAQHKSKKAKFRIGEGDKTSKAPAKKKESKVRVAKPKKSNVVPIHQDEDLPEAHEETHAAKRIAHLIKAKDLPSSSEG